MKSVSIKPRREKTMKGILKILFTLTLLTLIMSCAKERNNFIPDQNDQALEEFLTDVQSLSVEQTIKSNIPHYFYTENGSLIYIPESAFNYATGEKVFGEFTFEYIEIFNSSLLALYEVETATSTKVIENQGVFYLKATQDGQDIFVNNSKPIQVFTKNAEINDFPIVYYAEEDLAWSASPQVLIETGEWSITDPISSQTWSDFGYNYNTSKLGWIMNAVDPEFISEEKSNICVNIPTELANNSNVYAVFTDYESIVNLHNTNDVNGDFTIYCTDNAIIPIGENVTFVAISALNENNYYIGMIETTTDMDTEVSILMEKKTKNQILDILGMF